MRCLKPPSRVVTGCLYLCERCCKSVGKAGSSCDCLARHSQRRGAACTVCGGCRASRLHLRAVSCIHGKLYLAGIIGPLLCLTHAARQPENNCCVCCMQLGFSAVVRPSSKCTALVCWVQPAAMGHMVQPALANMHTWAEPAKLLLSVTPLPACSAEQAC